MSAFKYQWNQTIDVGTAGLSKQWTSIRHILSLLVTANACVHVTAYVAVRRSLSTTYTAVVLGLLLRQYVSYQFGVWADNWTRFQSWLAEKYTTWGPFYHHALTLIPTWMSNRIHYKVWDEITYPFVNGIHIDIPSMASSGHRERSHAQSFSWSSFKRGEDLFVWRPQTSSIFKVSSHQICPIL